MKKHLTSIIAIAILAVVSVFTGCEDPTTLNQPSGKYAKYWTPAGHTYVCVTQENPYRAEVYKFMEDEDAVTYYTTDSPDLTVLENSVIYGYEGMYPNFTLVHAIFENRTLDCVFTDTLTCTIFGSTFKLYR